MIGPISSLKHPFVKHLTKLKQNKNYRYQCRSVLIEGIKLLKEADPAKVRAIIACSLNLLKGWPPEKTWLADEAIIKKIAGTVSPEGVAAEIEMPGTSSLEGMRYVVGLDAVSDPGNMGTLLRSTLALGWEGAFILPGSCDPYNDKALRAGKGAQLKLPLRFGTAIELEKLCLQNRLDVWAADLYGTSAEEAACKTGCLLVLGNESHGLSKEVESFCQKVTLPMPGEMESLNVAAAGSILIYLLRR